MKLIMKREKSKRFCRLFGRIQSPPAVAVQASFYDLFTWIHTINKLQKDCWNAKVGTTH